MDRQTGCRKSSIAASAIDITHESQEKNGQLPASSEMQGNYKRARHTSSRRHLNGEIDGEPSFNRAVDSRSKTINTWILESRSNFDKINSGTLKLQQSNHFCNLFLLEDRGCESWREFL
jgi:hypothetical protein